MRSSNKSDLTFSEPPERASAKFWAIAAIAGVAAGIIGGLLMALLRFVQHWAWTYRSGNFLNAVRQTSATHRVEVLLAAGVVTGVALWGFRRFSGRPEVGLSSAIWLRDGQLPLFGTIYKGVLSIIIVGLGAALGREAAPKEIGAAIASRLSDLACLAPGQRRILAASAAGAGMAAVYNVPLGGALFALEVLLGSLTLSNVLPALAVSFIATWVSWLFLPAVPTYAVPSYQVSAALLAGSAAMGPVAGLLAVVYIRGIGWARACTPKGWLLLIMPPLAFLGVGIAATRFPELLGNGKNVVDETIDNPLSVPVIAGLLLLRPLATALCLRSGAPGGLFTPTLAFGALTGLLAGHAWLAIWPGISEDSIGAYAIIGTGAILAAATQGPVSAIVLMLELGSHVDTLIMPLLVAVAGATLVSRSIDSRSIYSLGVADRKS